MSEEQDTASGEPPRIVLYAFYAVMAIALIAVFVIVGLYGT